jgi:hypothetical protein
VATRRISPSCSLDTGTSFGLPGRLTRAANPARFPSERLLDRGSAYAHRGREGPSSQGSDRACAILFFLPISKSSPIAGENIRSSSTSLAIDCGRTGPLDHGFCATSAISPEGHAEEFSPAKAGGIQLPKKRP